jgi:hypothetical protein
VPYGATGLDYPVATTSISAAAIVVANQVEQSQLLEALRRMQGEPGGLLWPR